MVEQLPKHGDHTFISPEEIDKIYDLIVKEYETYLKTYNIFFPGKNSNGALALVFLKKHQGMLVHKDTVSSFVSSVNPVAGKDQQIRHLGRHGWYVLNKGDELPNENGKVPSGYHLLVNTRSPKPSFLWKALKRAGRISAQNFDQLKITYNNRCATCGSEDGKPHLLEQNQRTELQQGHMNPHKPLKLENTIPQCQICNQSYKDQYVFNEKGRVIAVANLAPVLAAAPEVQKEILAALSRKI